MPKFNESVVVGASTDQLWSLLHEPTALAACLPRIERIRYLSADDTLNLDAEVEVAIRKLAGPIILKVVDYQPPAYLLQTTIAHGPQKLAGELSLQLQQTDDTLQQSRLSVIGDVSSSFMGNIGLAFFVPTLPMLLNQMRPKLGDSARRQ